jgi:hypothetical protein
VIRKHDRIMIEAQVSSKPVELDRRTVGCHQNLQPRD